VFLSFIRETYGGYMVNLIGLLPVISGWDGKKTDEERQSAVAGWMKFR
jgi:hypothetical protein